MGRLFILWNILGVKWKWGTTVYRRRLCEMWKQSDSLHAKLTGHPGFCPYERDTLMSQVDDIWASWRVCTGLFNWAVCGGQTRDINEMSQQRDRRGKKIDKQRQASPLWSLQAHLRMSSLFFWAPVVPSITMGKAGMEISSIKPPTTLERKTKKQSTNKQARKQKPKMDWQRRIVCSSVNQTCCSPLSYLVFSCFFPCCSGRWPSKMTHPGTSK